MCRLRACASRLRKIQFCMTSICHFAVTDSTRQVLLALVLQICTGLFKAPQRGFVQATLASLGPGRQGLGLALVLDT